MRLKSILLWLGVGVLVAGLYLAAAYFQLHGSLRGFAEGDQLQVFVSGSCPHSQPVVASPPLPLRGASSFRWTGTTRP